MKNVWCGQDAPYFWYRMASVWKDASHFPLSFSPPPPSTNHNLPLRVQPASASSSSPPHQPPSHPQPFPSVTSHDSQTQLFFFLPQIFADLWVSLRSATALTRTTPVSLNSSVPERLHSMRGRLGVQLGVVSQRECSCGLVCLVWIGTWGPDVEEGVSEQVIESRLCWRFSQRSSIVHLLLTVHHQCCMLHEHVVHLNLQKTMLCSVGRQEKMYEHCSPTWVTHQAGISLLFTRPAAVLVQHGCTILSWQSESVRKQLATVSTAHWSHLSTKQEFLLFLQTAGRGLVCPRSGELHLTRLDLNHMWLETSLSYTHIHTEVIFWVCTSRGDKHWWVNNRHCDCETRLPCRAFNLQLNPP